MYMHVNFDHYMRLSVCDIMDYNYLVYVSMHYVHEYVCAFSEHVCIVYVYAYHHGNQIEGHVLCTYPQLLLWQLLCVHTL